MQTAPVLVPADTSASAPADPESDPRFPVITAVIEEMRPMLRRDGGDCTLVAIDGNKAMVRLSGACVMCRLSSMTLETIQTRIIEKLGSFIRVVPVMGAGAPRLPGAAR